MSANVTITTHSLSEADKAELLGGDQTVSGSWQFVGTRCILRNATVSNSNWVVSNGLLINTGEANSRWAGIGVKDMVALFGYCRGRGRGITIGTQSEVYAGSRNGDILIEILAPNEGTGTPTLVNFGRKTLPTCVRGSSLVLRVTDPNDMTETNDTVLELDAAKLQKLKVFLDTL